MRRVGLLWLAVWLPTAGWAHELRPVYLEVLEQAEGMFQVQWKSPLSLPEPPTVVMPEACRPEAAPLHSRLSDAVLVRQPYRCKQGISGSRIGLNFPGANPAVTTIVQVNLLSGEQHAGMLAPGEVHWQVPERESPLAVALDYTKLGIEHIWLGVDHLLFVACLLFIARTPRRLLLTITGFTLAHSLTLVFSTLGWVRLPIPPVEAVIALSIVFLACEIARPREDSWTWRYPVLVSSLFGLLHGFGFASVLGDIGLPQTQLPAALLSFNLGVEIGQLLFVAACLLFFLSARHWLTALRWQRLPQLSSYLVGTLASFWLFDRISGFIA